MQVTSEVLILNAVSKPKKDNSGVYYILDFLDTEDVSYKNFITENLYNKILNLKLKRFDKCLITLNIGKARSGTGFDIFVSDIDKLPFDDKDKK